MHGRFVSPPKPNRQACAHQVYGNFRISQMDGAQNFFAVVDIDVTEYRKSEQAHRFLPVYEKHDTLIFRSRSIKPIMRFA